MRLITRDVDYAVRALVYLAKHPGRPICASELVKDLGVPRPFLRRIMQSLGGSRILNSAKGKGGGFSLKQAADKITVDRLMEIFHGPLEFNCCGAKKKVCPASNSCNLRREMRDIEGVVLERLGRLSIQSLAKELTRGLKNHA